MVGQLRQVDTDRGPVTYTLERKPVKNLNLRVTASGEVRLSIPKHCSVRQADRLIQERCAWISAAQEKLRAAVPLPPPPDPAVCRALLEEAVARVYPSVQPLGVAMPVLKVRAMRSQWGNCHWRQGYITLNTALARCPEPLRDYVALHELVHFLHHDHGPGFQAQMTALMPDWQTRRRQLRGS